jgi:hypothetical protein
MQMTHAQSQAIHASHSLGALVALLVQAKYPDELVATFADAHKKVTFAVAALRRYEQKAAA